MRRAHGFTLIELLVALVVFGVLAALSLRAISNAAEQRTFIEDENRKWRDLDRLFATLEADLASAVASPATFVGRNTPPGDGPWLALVRAGHSSAQDVPSPPRAVEYRAIDGRLARSVGPEHADAPDARTTVRYPSELRAVAARYLSARGEWLPAWQTNDGSLPRAMEVSVQLASGEQVRRVLLAR